MRNSRAALEAGTILFTPRKDRDIVKYIVEARAGDRWVALGQPYNLKEKAMAAEEAALESTLWEDARILVVNDRQQIVKIID